MNHPIMRVVLAGVAAVLMFASTAGAGVVAEYSHEWPNPLTDASGHGLDAVNGGGVQDVSFVAAPNNLAVGWKLGQIIGSYTYSGGPDYLSLPSAVIASGQSFTFTALVNSNDPVGHRTFLSSNRMRFQRATSSSIYVSTTKPSVGLPYTTNKDNFFSANNVFQTDTWYFLALRYDAVANLGEVFLQAPSALPPTLGSPVLSFVPTDPMNASYPQTSFRLGMDASGMGGADGWNGFMDRVRFYEGAMGNADLQAVMQEYWIPEPAAWLLLMLGVVGVFRLRR